MARRKKFKVSIGDIFTIPFNQELKAIGQVVLQGATSDVFIIFDCIYKENEMLNKIQNQPILFMFNTIDTRLEDGEWQIIGNDRPPKNLALKNYISETLDGYVVLDAGGQIIRGATENDVKSLSNLSSISPEIVEDAVKAKFGNGEWYPYLDKLLY
ncbi:Imm26 family immunity protein [Pseudalkalibacillus sp. SCS-8]|uniref:Imm26 family immunity protein n=1 Tax=Pseudalkalibacillus nanhaiensis TaxID=3115291 RepID=UPI0032DBA2CC